MNIDENYITIKIVSLNNRCPVCYDNDSLQLTFKQKFIETTLYKSITSEIKQNLQCEKCQSNIYPVQYTAEIDRVLEYHQKALEPKKSITYLKTHSWIAIIGISVVLLAIIALISFV